MRQSALPVLDRLAMARHAAPQRPALTVLRDSPVLRRAHAGDSASVHAHLEQFVGPGLLLPRSAEQVACSIGDFTIALEDDAVVGSVALRAYSADLAEIGALAVAPHLHGTGLGRRLVEAAIDAARAAGIARVFALTLQDGFFHRLGFVTTGIAAFPQKIALDCASCSRRPTCAERAVMLDL